MALSLRYDRGCEEKRPYTTRTTLKKKNMNIHTTIYKRHPSSFRDSKGFIFFGEEGKLYRQVNFCHREHYDYLISSGLYQNLVAEHLLIAHKEVDLQLAASSEAYRVIQPHQLPFISYPYEWCFSQLKDAALLTLAIQQRAIEHGMILKDASGYNVQFMEGKPIFIDTLSFEKYQEGRLWVAYRQFCKQFLAPLALMSIIDPRLQQLLRIHLDGIPLEFAASLLPFRAWLKRGLAVHLFLHAKSQILFSKHGARKKLFRATVSRQNLITMVQHLTTTIQNLSWNPPEGEWSRYISGDSYHLEALKDKKRIIQEYFDVVKPKVVWDIGANTGTFSRIASMHNTFVLSIDSDPLCVEYNYQQVKQNRENGILPLLVDCVNPSPAIGWANRERQTLFDRGPCDMALALAFVHHIALSNNVPFELIAQWFSQFSKTIAIEFVPKDDPKVQSMLASRESEFPDYTVDAFENAFKKYFSILRRDSIVHSSRVLYLMKKH